MRGAPEEIAPSGGVPGWRPSRPAPPSWPLTQGRRRCRVARAHVVASQPAACPRHRPEGADSCRAQPGEPGWCRSASLPASLRCLPGPGAPPRTSQPPREPVVRPRPASRKVKLQQQDRKPLPNAIGLTPAPGGPLRVAGRPAREWRAPLATAVQRGGRAARPDARLHASAVRASSLAYSSACWAPRLTVSPPPGAMPAGRTAVSSVPAG